MSVEDYSIMKVIICQHAGFCTKHVIDNLFILVLKKFWS